MLESAGLSREPIDDSLREGTGGRTNESDAPFRIGVGGASR